MGSIIHIDLEDVASQTQSVIDNTRTARVEMEKLSRTPTEEDGNEQSTSVFLSFCLFP